MKYRSGFVSNSSASSFVIYKDNLAPIQECIVRNYLEFIQILNKKGAGLEYAECAADWCMNEDEDSFSFDTYMDNFYLEEFFEGFGIELSERWHS